jgi:hypothetical protein
MLRGWVFGPPTPELAGGVARVESHEVSELPPGFPEPFFARINGETGAVEFFDGSGAALASRGGSADFEPWLAADLRGAPREGDVAAGARGAALFACGASVSASGAAAFGGAQIVARRGLAGRGFC